MSQPPPAPPADGLYAVSEALVTAHQYIGAEFKALSQEEQSTDARERLGTVRRMRQNAMEAAHQIVTTLEVAATVSGMRALGLNRQCSKDAAGGDMSELLPVGAPKEKLRQAAQSAQAVVRYLEKTYAPTQKYAALAVARCPEQMAAVFRAVRQAANLLAEELTEHDMAEDGAELHSCVDVLEQLQARVCHPAVPVPAGALTAEAVTAAILSNPAIAAAATAAVRRLNP